MSYEPKGFSLPTDGSLHIAAAQTKTPGLSAFGLAVEGVQTRPGMDGKAPDLKTMVKCSARLSRL